MATDYQGNSKSRREPEKPLPAKPKVEKVVATEVIVQKRGIGRKFKDLFIEADPKSVVRYVAAAVLLPAAKNMVYDAFTKGSERMIFGEGSSRRNINQGPRITYNSPVNRGYRDSPLRSAPPVSQEPRALGRHRQESFILASKEEAQTVLERLSDLIDTYEFATVADLNDLLGLPTTYVDNKWGWLYLADTPIRQIREGFLLDLPPAEPLQQ